MPLLKTDHDRHTAPWIDTRMAGLLKRRATEQTNAKSVLGLGDVANFRDRCLTSEGTEPELLIGLTQPSHLCLASPTSMSSYLCQ